MLAMLLLAIAMSGGGGRIAPPQTYDKMELNTTYDECGQEQYTQVIFYDWSPDYRRHDAMGWMLVLSSSQVPTKVGDRWVCKWTDGQYRYHVISPIFTRTHTLGDPEKDSRRLCPERCRSHRLIGHR